MPLSSEEQTIFESVRAICIARINICRQLANFIDNATKEEFEKFCHDLFTVEFVFNVRIPSTSRSRNNITKFTTEISPSMSSKEGINREYPLAIANYQEIIEACDALIKFKDLDDEQIAFYSAAVADTIFAVKTSYKESTVDQTVNQYVIGLAGYSAYGIPPNAAFMSSFPPSQRNGNRPKVEARKIANLAVKNLDFECWHFDALYEMLKEEGIISKEQLTIHNDHNENKFDTSVLTSMSVKIWNEIGNFKTSVKTLENTITKVAKSYLLYDSVNKNSIDMGKIELVAQYKQQLNEFEALWAEINVDIQNILPDDDKSEFKQLQIEFKCMKLATKISQLKEEVEKEKDDINKEFKKFQESIKTRASYATETTGNVVTPLPQSNDAAKQLEEAEKQKEAEIAELIKLASSKAIKDKQERKAQAAAKYKKEEEARQLVAALQNTTIEKTQENYPLSSEAYNILTILSNKEQRKNLKTEDLLKLAKECGECGEITNGYLIKFKNKAQPAFIGKSDGASQTQETVLNATNATNARNATVSFHRQHRGDINVDKGIIAKFAEALDAAGYKPETCCTMSAKARLKS
jgi:regulator of protease activity HflC (stomatin/prohibitin superfamily)